MSYRKSVGLVAGFAITATLTVAMIQRASADEDSRTRCRSRVEKAEEHYRHEALEHGKHSAKADEARAKLKGEWEKCWIDDHAWYDPSHNKWRTERNWDDKYDWDHALDHDH